MQPIEALRSFQVIPLSVQEELPLRSAHTYHIVPFTSQFYGHSSLPIISRCFLVTMSLIFKRFITWVGKVKPEDVKASSGQKMMDSVVKVVEELEAAV